MAVHYHNDIAEIERELELRFGPHHDDFVEVKLENLKDICKKKGISPTGLARLTGISQAQTWRILKDGAQKRNLGMLLAISLALECDLGEVVASPPRFGAVISETELERIAPRLLDVRMVRTRIDPKTPVDVTTFYYKTVISSSLGESEIKSLRDLPSDAVLIQGPAGQGKSTLLRYLAVQAVESRAVIPIFLELAQIHDESLWGAVSSELQLVGLRLNQELEKSIYERGEIALLLDGLHDLTPDRRSGVLKELGQLKKQYPNLPIVVASRPLVAAIPNWLQVVDLVPLGEADLSSVIGLHTSPDEAETLVKALVSDAVSFSIRKLITSPLMVELLIVHFRRSQNLPAGVAEFFNGVLYAVMETLNVKLHGPSLPLRCGLDPLAFRRFFEAFCFVIQGERGEAPIHRFDLEEMSRKALTLVSQASTPSAALDDVLVVTGLMEEEEGYCRFLHKSVREYFAALFVRHSDEFQAELLYQDLRRSWQKWMPVLEFLEVIDRQRCLEYVILPEYADLEPFEATTLASNYLRLALNKRDSKTLKPVQEPQFDWRLSRSTSYTLRREELLGVLDQTSVLHLIQNESWGPSASQKLEAQGKVVVDRASSDSSSGRPGWAFSPETKCGWQIRNSRNSIQGRMFLPSSPTLEQRAAYHRQRFQQLRSELDPR
ncbi:helix-turn-helix domain-containing protein [Blastopirellula sp. J2-11]|uniref:NACHT domain-containing protein n=1 Tax=Blastopirellula sp. J2-11 TaxID=2943192 RepID=UPI0021C8F73D|nr:helix-turn-helix domain-containing protein [Blastopirellula sp. J2-11]UUO04997.1 helix-turn-helix domain-containing protein [Blastopirellula sp. J2-11]